MFLEGLAAGVVIGFLLWPFIFTVAPMLWRQYRHKEKPVNA